MDRQLVSEGDAFLWLSRGDLKGETESEIIAPQDQALPNKLLATRILQTETDAVNSWMMEWNTTYRPGH